MPSYTKVIDAREQQTPAYALTGRARRAIDLTYQRAESLRNALPAGVYVKTCSIIPTKGQYVSGLNVPDNLVTIVGSAGYNRHKRLQSKALKALEARNG